MGHIAALKRRVERRLACSYVVGLDVEDAMRACRLARDRGWATTICPWNARGDPVAEVAASYHEAVDAIAREGLDCSLSLKSPALGDDFALLRQIVEHARDRRVALHFDSHGPESADATFDLLERSLEIYPRLGCTLPSRWRRSLADAERVVAWGIPVRLVKGQWEDPGAPSLDPVRGYLELIDALAGRAAHVAVASHDVVLAKRCFERLRDSGTGFSLEQLYGFPLDLTRHAREQGIPVRIYLGYGKAMLPYGLSLIRKRPIIAWWIVRDLLRGKRLRLG